MSIMQNAKEFFFGPQLENQEDAYYDDSDRYDAEDGASYPPRRDYYEDYGARDRAEPREYDREREPYRPSRTHQPVITPITLSRYSEARRIGDAFRQGDAVVFNVTHMDREEARRTVDFAAGVCVALNGSMEKLATSDFALIPEHAIIDHADLERAARSH